MAGFKMVNMMWEMIIINEWGVIVSIFRPTIPYNLSLITAY